MFKKITLENGLRIITAPMKNTQTVMVLVLVGAGSKYEEKNINGISHFLEHMFFKGTQNKPNTLKLIEPLDRVGGKYNAFTDKEITGYWAKVNFKHLDLALDWVSDIYLNSKLEKKEIEKEKGVIVEEINMYLDIPMNYIGILWEKLLYGNQPSGRSILGEKRIITKLKRRHFLDYLKNYYSAKNTVICVAGNINSKLVEKKIKKYFKDISENSPTAKLKVIEKQTHPQNLIYFKKTDQTHLCLGVRGYDLFHPLRYAQEILAVILGGNMSSRLWLLIRERQGLAYYVHTFSETTTDTGYLATQAGVDHQNVEKTINLIVKEYKDLKNKKIGKKELNKAKDYLKGIFSLSLESSDVQASFYASQEILAKKVLTPEQYFSEIDKITQYDILKTAQDIFQPDKLNLAIIGPFRAQKKFQRILKF